MQTKCTNNKHPREIFLLCNKKQCDSNEIFTSISVKYHIIYYSESLLILSAPFTSFSFFPIVLFTSLSNQIDAIDTKDSWIYAMHHTCNVYARVRKMSMFSWWWDALVCIPYYHTSVHHLWLFLFHFNWLSAIFPPFVFVSATIFTNLAFKPCRLSTIFIPKMFFYPISNLFWCQFCSWIRECTIYNGNSHVNKRFGDLLP